MNKPDNSDGSGGQLTAGTNTCHLLQIQSPWTWIRETGQTHFFAVFRTYKRWIPVVLRVPSASTRIFLRVVDTDSYQQSASMCVYQATQDGSRGLTFAIYFNHGIQVLSRWRNSRIICHSLVWLIQHTKYSGCITMIYKKLAPDGSNDIHQFFLRFPCSSTQE
jgi:Na+-transporting NADH:ubiquinone oxidoreductase subunit NqrA